MPIQSDYDVISGAGRDMTAGLTQELMYRREKEEKQKVQDKSDALGRLNIGMEFMNKAKTPEEFDEAAKIYKTLGNDWTRIMGKDIPMPEYNSQTHYAITNINSIIDNPDAPESIEAMKKMSITEQVAVAGLIETRQKRISDMKLKEEKDEITSNVSENGRYLFKSGKMSDVYAQKKEFTPHAPSYANYTDGKRVVRVPMGSKEQVALHNNPNWNVVAEGVGGIDKKTEKKYEIVKNLNNADAIKKGGWAMELVGNTVTIVPKAKWAGLRNVEPSREIKALRNNAQDEINSLGEGGQGGSSGEMFMNEAIKVSKQMMGGGEPKQKEPQSDMNMQEAYGIYMTDSTGTKLIERYGQEGAKKIREWIKVNIESGGALPASSLRTP